MPNLKSGIVLIESNVLQIYQMIYRIYHMYSDRQAWENSVNPDEMLQNVASHDGLYSLPLIQQFFDITSGSKLYLFKF